MEEIDLPPGLLQGCRCCDHLGAVEVSLGSVLAHTDLTREQRDKVTPDEIIQQMKAGNERFRSGKPQPRDLMREAMATAKGQYPAAIVFSCIDSRAPVGLTKLRNEDAGCARE
jgi:carbonic anhydrase